MNLFPKTKVRQPDWAVEHHVADSKYAPKRKAKRNVSNKARCSLERMRLGTQDILIQANHVRLGKYEV